MILHFGVSNLSINWYEKNFAVLVSHKIYTFYFIFKAGIKILNFFSLLQFLISNIFTDKKFLKNKKFRILILSLDNFKNLQFLIHKNNLRKTAKVYPQKIYQNEFFRVSSPYNLLLELIRVFEQSKKKKKCPLTDTRCNMGSALLITSGAPIAGGTGNTIFARALTRALITCFSRCSNQMTITRCNKNIIDKLYIVLIQLQG